MNVLNGSQPISTYTMVRIFMIFLFSRSHCLPLESYIEEEKDKLIFEGPLSDGNDDVVDLRLDFGPDDSDQESEDFQNAFDSIN